MAWELEGMERGRGTPAAILPGAPAGPGAEHEPERRARRRRLLAAATAAGAVLGERRMGSAQGAGYNPAASWRSPELRLVRRATMGLTQEEAARAVGMGYRRWLEQQLNAGAIDDREVEAAVASLYPTLTMTPAALKGMQGGAVAAELQEATLFRAVYSRRQLYERMVEFWSDHFNIDVQKAGVLKTVDDRAVIRANALGSFPALLRASAHSPAMLRFLDNDTSRSGHPNINYARELMELHTIGVDGGYTAEDIKEVARCFTGWTFDRRDGATYGTFVFDRRFHDDGSKRVLGHTIPAGGGIQDGETVLEILVRHPSCGPFLAGKMARWFLGYDPPRRVVDRLAQVYARSGGDIRGMVREVLGPRNLPGAPAKHKRPYHLLVSALRATRAAAAGMQGARQRLRLLGQPLFEWDSPDGYPDRLDYWAGLLLPRWSLGASLLNREIAGISVDTTWLEGLPNAAAVANAIDAALFGGEMPPAEKAELAAFLQPEPPTAARIRDAVSLALASPGFQWY